MTTKTKPENYSKTRQIFISILHKHFELHRRVSTRRFPDRAHCGLYTLTSQIRIGSFSKCHLNVKVSYANMCECALVTCFAMMDGKFLGTIFS